MGTKRINIIGFFSVIFTVLALGAGLAHLYSLPNKINLPQETYFTVQQVYRGWQFLGLVFFGQLIFTFLLALKIRKYGKAFHFALSAFVCVIGTLVVFFTFTYPANMMTNNWTMAPHNWQVLRNQWEYSHAVGALLNLAALAFLTLCLLQPLNEESILSTRVRKVS